MKITVSAIINSPIIKVWQFFNEPQHITKWNQAADTWHCPASENDLKLGGKFKHTMTAKDNSFSFDFEGVYTQVDLYKQIDYTLADDRKVSVYFKEENNQTTVTEIFETENENTLELQQQGWQAILNNFKNYTEHN